VLVGEGEAHLRAVKKMTATAACVEEAELDGEGWKRLRQHSSSDPQPPFVQRRSDAAARLASSTAPAVQASSNESEREEEKMSGGELGVGCVHPFDRRGLL
jgi:hypothetical protein